MHLLYPSDPYEKSQVDEAYVEELAAVAALGLSHSLFSFEDFESDKFNPKQALPVGADILYRGWMMTPEAYERLFNAVKSERAQLKTGVVEYRRCHYLPEWYSLCTDFTPETIVADSNADFVSLMEGKHWPAFFVKDYVKSLTTSRGSVAQSPDGIADVVSLIEKYRGAVEGGVCIRKFEDLVPETEERYFVMNGRACARDGDVPALVQEIAKRIRSPFYSVDTVLATTGELRLIELGDGQVSDRKKWSPERFAAMLHV
ncbi:ATP-grasp domain-containing protein [Janthinobacterium fluminis]|uniref:ATP-grasp domain-containing protein n=1 Tax=Janthinobacterium fluminis TaxID=2987524 RepID=A0ABT5JVA4_9BURK|nr:ATP-grasp domain-containing protein [Janthinobacterium fluminis]MDC8756088.1 ATP-grasp domain-containing protein [Janthinobacterium fluminis]